MTNRSSGESEPVMDFDHSIDNLRKKILEGILRRADRSVPAVLDVITKEESALTFGMGITDHELLRIMLNDNIHSFITPDEARKNILSYGYEENALKSIVKDKIGGHSTRALAVIALGTQPRLEYVVYMNLRAIDYFESPSELGGRMIGIQTILGNPTEQTILLKKLIEESSK